MSYRDVTTHYPTSLCLLVSCPLLALHGVHAHFHTIFLLAFLFCFTYRQGGSVYFTDWMITYGLDKDFTDWFKMEFIPGRLSEYNSRI